MTNTKYYGVQQSHCGHWYRFIFDEATLINDLGDNFMDLNGEEMYPFGGSNSSNMFIEPLDNEEDIEWFLIRPDEPDVEDPMLVDLGEYLLTVDTDYGSCTQMWLDKLGLKQDDLTQEDDCYGRCAEVLAKADEMKKKGVIWFDYDNPFYGADRGMRYSEFLDLYEKEMKS